MRRFSIIAGAVIAGLLLCGTAGAEIKDRIKTVDNRFFTGEITEETYEKVRYKTGDVEASLSQKRVAEITWGDMPSDYHSAEGYRKRGEYDKAAERYAKALKAPIGRDFWLKPYTRYHLGTCYLQMGELAKAEEQFKLLIENYPTARYFPDANIGLGRVYLKQGKWDDAMAAFKVVIDKVDPYTGKPVFKEDLYYIARLLNAEALAAGKDYDRAVVELEKLIPETEGKFPEIALEARQKKARVKVISGKGFAEGLKEYRQIIEKAVERMKGGATSTEEARLMRVAAKCYNGLGDAYREHGTGDDRYKRALLEYLRVVTVLAAAAEGDDLAHALKWAAWCCSQMGNKERATALESELKSRFPDYAGGD